MIESDGESDEDTQDSDFKPITPITPITPKGKGRKRTSNITPAKSQQDKWQQSLAPHSKAVIKKWHKSLELFAKTHHPEDIITSFFPGIGIPVDLCSWGVDIIRSCRAKQSDE